MVYQIIIERADDGSYSAYVPELPGCVACGDTRAEALTLIMEAIIVHQDSLEGHGEASDE